VWLLLGISPSLGPGVGIGYGCLSPSLPDPVPGPFLDTDPKPSQKEELIPELNNMKTITKIAYPCSQSWETRKHYSKIFKSNQCQCLYCFYQITLDCSENTVGIYMSRLTNSRHSSVS